MPTKLGYTIIYVQDVSVTVAFYEAAFGLERRFVHESGLYAEMATGDVTLSFAGDDMAEMNGVHVRPNRLADRDAAGFELAMVSDDPEALYVRAVEAGATPVKPVTEKPWGQRVGYVRDLNGCLVEICSPVTS